ncbi:DUF2062 domain-containing protein [Gallaecimonas pentaromativorans]|uniref:DUF2062 domain-containing protein n=2 Tax=Gallaecimonas pentaromativorans TaxID=584787 RepID=A0A3N1NYA3_9GAMM|nr:DUF2062 domain-containing protein [Gallaecimonas pentaromativorans]MED5523893.1 DUF2062 domain-containing protein [Pseudomonadota bacterium]ROQ24824.1 hypothetical protein EDC28_10671 [Gallaecimonas pentaromativorans]
MPKKTIKRFMPDHAKIRNHKHLKIFGSLVHEPNLWCLNRRSAAGAFAVGLFFAFVPVPFQMLLAAGGAILFRVNLPLSVALVWLTNPVTMPPIFYGVYKVGSLILGRHGDKFHFEPTWDWLVGSIETVGPAFLLGCLVCASVASLIGYFGISWLWRYSVAKSWQKRKEQRR